METQQASQQAPQQAPHIQNRISGEKYILNNEIRIWTGKEWHCQHGRRK